MKKSSKGLVIALLFAVLLNAVVFTPSVSAAENRAMVGVKVHRIHSLMTSKTILKKKQTGARLSP
jgi:hypothetical protein